jgi:hypothetical protein
LEARFVVAVLGATVVLFLVFFGCAETERDTSEKTNRRKTDSTDRILTLVV